MTLRTVKHRWKRIAAWLAVLIVLGVGSYFALKKVTWEECGANVSIDEPVYSKGLPRAIWDSFSPQQRRISELKNKYSGQLFEIPGVVGVGTRPNRILVSVDTDKPHDMDRIPKKLEGCDVEIEEMPGGIGPASAPFDSRIRPLIAATQMGDAPRRRGRDSPPGREDI